MRTGVQNTKTESNNSNDESLVTAIEHTYKHALLMFLADSQHLTPEDIRLITNYLAYQANLAQISALTSE
jgi:hypothetical protein